MFKIRKQIRNIYAISALSSFQIAGASWVALLAMRGFSLVQIGFAECLFHVTSLLFEIPSGVISDVFGRKKTMILSQCFFVISAFLMMIAESTVSVYIALMLAALGYNFSSGTREALAYDSLKKAGKEEEYDKYASTEMMIYRIGNASALLCAGLALFIGYRKAYCIDMILGTLCLYFSFQLKEVPANEEAEKQKIVQQIWECVKESILFLLKNGRATRLMFWNAFIGAIATLYLFFLQAQLPLKGLPMGLLGPSLFVVGLGGAVGAKLVQCFSEWKYSRISILCVSGVILGAMTILMKNPWIMCIGGFASAMFDDLIQVRSDVLLNSMIPSEQRATLVSVSSFCFSIIMIVMSPLVGWIFSLL